MSQKKVVYYSDELHDDFASSNGKIHAHTITEDYPYTHSSLLWRIAAFILYRLIATPLVFLFLKICFGLKIKNRKAVRRIKGGWFLYANHTQSAADAFIPTLAAFPKKTNIITSADAVSVPCLGTAVAMMGAIPLAGNLKGMKKLLQALESKTAAGQVTAIYPEAHIWPYYNDIRPFPDNSFAYPMRFGVPAVASVVTYRQRKLLRGLPPLITVTLGEPVYPDTCANKQEMCRRIYSFMKQTVRTEKSYAYRIYERKGKEL